jgi:NADPH:quinone reductase-like Zn-dependent oxidoreductase
MVMRSTDARSTNGADGPTMRAVTQYEYGSADTWHVRDIPRPSVSGKEVLVEVHAAGMDLGTWHFMTGEPRLARPAIGLRRPKNPVPGTDVAGIAVAVGPEVTGVRVGDRVYGGGRGSFAEYTVAHEGSLSVIPASVTDEQAAAVPVSAVTALQALHKVAKVQPGQSVVVVGAGGGVGTYAVQLAKAAGATVTGVCSTGKLDVVRSLGADDVIDYTTTDFADGSRQWDVIIDTGGNRSLRHLRRAMTPKGTLVLVGGENNGKWIGALGRSLRGVMMSPFIGQRVAMFLASLRTADLEQLSALLESGQLRASVDSTFPLEQAADAMRHLASGQVRGKIVITV